MLDYATVFLEKADLLKYRLYSLLARPYVHDITITDLAGMWPNKYQPTYSVFQEVLADLVELTGKSTKVVRAAMLKATNLPLGIDQYRVALVRRSMVFHFVDDLLRSPNPSLLKFCEENFVSTSTVSRKMHPLNVLLKQYGVKVQLTRMRFMGPETSVRYLLYSIYWWVYRGAAWPFDPITPKALHEECDQIGIFNDRPITQTQMQYFLAISHLRIGKGHKVQPLAWLEAFDQRVVNFQLRQGELVGPFSTLDCALYNYFQISQPRFDGNARQADELPIEMALLADPVTQRVVDALVAKIYQPKLGDLEADLYTNLLRLAAGYTVCGGAFPQAEEYIAGGLQIGSETLMAHLTQAVLALPDTADYKVFKQNADLFVTQAARLAQAYQQTRDETAQVQVRLEVDPDVEGYRHLDAFINCVPWVARVSDDEPDLLIKTNTTQQTFTWYPDALKIPAYRESLINILIDRRQQKLKA